MNKILCCAWLCMLTNSLIASVVQDNRIVMTGYPNPASKKDVFEVTVTPAEKILYESNKTVALRQHAQNGEMKWTINAAEPQILFGNFFGVDENVVTYIAEPGDSIHIEYRNGKAVFSGRGFEKYLLRYQLQSILASMEQMMLKKGLSIPDRPVTSLNDYLAWHQHCNQILGQVIPVLEQARPSVSAFAWNMAKEQVFYEIEELRLQKFSYLKGTGKAMQSGIWTNQFGLSHADLAAIYDSTLSGPAARWLQTEAPVVSDAYYLFRMALVSYYREKEIFFKNNKEDTAITGPDPVDKYVAIYNTAKKKYKGLILEEVLAFTLYYKNAAIRDAGFVPKTEALLADFYARPGYPEYKQAVKEVELLYRDKRNMKNSPGFELSDAKNNIFPREKLRGKLTILDFWHTGAEGQEEMKLALAEIREQFQSDTNLLFISVSVDKDKATWLNNIAREKDKSIIQLYTQGKGKVHSLIQQYVIQAFPSVYLLDAEGRAVWLNPWPDPRKDNGKKFIETLNEQLALMKDGPYVLHEDQTKSYNVNGLSLIKQKLIKPCVEVLTDQNKTFSVCLKKSLAVENSVYDAVEKLFVLSDIEGNFKAFRKLLESNGIIDNNFNWAFGKGHLVFCGDMFDRGEQVTECLWLIYMLEEKAKKAGGYVHFILGNHEIMNLQGNFKYVREKYHSTASVTGKSLLQLYGENSELGRWLRTKNIVEKIGGLLFMHGGLDKKIANENLSVANMNDLARPYFGIRQIDTTNRHLKLLYSSISSPFWYRGYYPESEKKQAAIKDQLDSVLYQYSATRIITGHTIKADTISVWYDNKVINTDTKHAEGKSEALLIEGNNYYRVNQEGSRRLLFIDERKTKIN